MIVIIEGFAIWKATLDDYGKIQPLKRTLCAYLPSLIISGGLYSLNLSGSIIDILILVYFQTAVGIAVVGAIMNGLSALKRFLGNRRNGDRGL